MNSPILLLSLLATALSDGLAFQAPPLFAGKTANRRVLNALAAPVDVGIKVAEKVQPSVALVTPKGVRNITSRGSGFLISFADKDDTYVLTAAHVAAPGWQIEVTFSDDAMSNTSYEAAVVGRNTTLDLALLQLNQSAGDAAAPLEIATGDIPVGTLVFAHGYPATRMKGPAMTSGIVCGIACGLGMPGVELKQGEQYGNTEFVVTDAAMAGGMSGGPLVSVDGRVVGTNALVRPDLRALGNYAVSSTEIHNFLDHCSRSIVLNEATSANNANSSPPSRVFRVVLFNDRMNKKERVEQVLGEVAGLNTTIANDVMMQAHTIGRGTIAELDDSDEANKLCQLLRQQDILVEVESGSIE